jgi:aryl-alcohol dehydrogenase-like predicted oxidoreductase
VLAQGEDVVPIPGTKRRSYLEQNAAAVDVELTDDDLARIDAELPAAVGARYDSRGMQATLNN